MTRFITHICVIAIALLTSAAFAQTDTTFTYQGSLHDQGAAANGSFNLEFSLFDAVSGGSQIGSAVMFNDHPIVEGLFTVELDFGASAFDNTGRWLEISVNGTELSPRQPVTRSPYSIQTRGIFVDENNNVGIGTSAPSSPLHVESDADRVIFGHATANSGTTYGVYGRSNSTDGRGVFGIAAASTGITYGVYGLSQRSTSGRGVYGLASAGANIWVVNSSDGTVSKL